MIKPIFSIVQFWGRREFKKNAHILFTLLNFYYLRIVSKSIILFCVIYWNADRNLKSFDMNWGGEKGCFLFDLQIDSNGRFFALFSINNQFHLKWFRCDVVIWFLYKTFNGPVEITVISSSFFGLLLFLICFLACRKQRCEYGVRLWGIFV